MSNPASKQMADGAIIARALAAPAMSERRWEAAENNRLNRAHWRGAMDQPVNVDISTDLATLRTRSTYEARRNPTVAGVIDTYSKDVSGREGPMLLVVCDDPDYASAAQDLWWEWFQNPDVAGRIGGVDYIRLWVLNCFQCGEFLAQKVTERDRPGPGVDAAQVHPPAAARDADGAGVRARRPAGDPADRGRPPARILHHRPDQNGGLPPQHRQIQDDRRAGHDPRVPRHRGRPGPRDPVARHPLESTGELRDFDAEVLDAARSAANQAVFWYTEHVDAKYMPVNEIADVERRQQQTGPPGWKPAMLTPTQPGPNYTEFRDEKLRDIGRPIGMPLMMIKLGSEEHNFSSARFDGEIYKRGIACTREWLERRVLNRLVTEVLREGELFATANPNWKYAALRRRPKDVEFLWIWPPLAHVDPEKQAAEEQTRMASGTLSFDEACAAAGKNPDTQIKKLGEIVKKFAEPPASRRRRG
jgi:capsid protein